MCGLVGVAGSLEFKDEGLMKRLLIIDYLRGTDSTGLASIRHNGDVHLVKAAVNPIDLFDMKRFPAALTGATSRAFIGHNRAATQGKVSNLNAHPFVCDHIIGAHNGTLDRASWTRLEEASGVQTNVDSEAIFWSIAKIGIDETIKLMEEGSTPATGAWALVWYDLNDGTVNFLRNKHRPLWRAWTKDLKKLMWASEWPMLNAAVSLGNVSYDLYEDAAQNSFWEFKEDRLYTADVSALISGTFDPIKDFNKRELKGRAPVSNVYGFSNKDRGASSGTPPFRGSTTPTGSTSGSASNSHTSGVMTLFGNNEDPFLGFVSKDEFDRMTKGKCSYCDEDVHYEDVGLVIHENLEFVLCPECSADPTTTRVYAAPLNYHNYVHTANMK